MLRVLLPGEKQREMDTETEAEEDGLEETDRWKDGEV